MSSGKEHGEGAQRTQQWDTALGLTQNTNLAALLLLSTTAWKLLGLGKEPSRATEDMMTLMHHRA